MLSVLLLFSLLLAAVEVNAAPFDKGSRQEELVTRCIVEVLSNALAKPNAPPIDPECKEILKKSSKHNQDEKDGEPTKYEMNANVDKRRHDSKEETKTDLPQDQNEEKRHHAESESREEIEEQDVKDNEHSEEKEESTGHSKERAFVDEDNEEEKVDHKDHYEKEDVEKRNKYHEESHEAEHNILDEKPYHIAKNAEELPGEDDEVKNLEDIVKRHPLNKSWKEQFFHPEKYHSVHSDEMSEENDDHEEEKRNFKPNNEDFRHKLFDFEEKRSHHEEPRNHVASAEKTPHFRGYKPHYGEASMENHLIKDDIDKRYHHEKDSSEESREKRHHYRNSEEEPEHHGREESNEKDFDSPHYEDKRQHEERKRYPNPQNSRLNYEQSNEESEEDIDKRHDHEMENFYRTLKHHLQGNEEEEPYQQDKKPDKKRHYIGEEMVDEMKRYYPEFSNEKDPRRYEDGKSQNYREDGEETSFPDNEMYRPHQAEKNRRFSNKHGFSSDPLRWKGRYFEDMDNHEEDRKRSLQVKNIFPDYGDYDLWGKRQFLDDMNREYGERSPAKTHKFVEKRQHDKMDELAQLLNYKKKSVEFPDFYDSGEIKKRHYDERGKINQRPLTDEEEKEFENLALMDLELQRIAEKLSNNRQG